MNQLSEAKSKQYQTSSSFPVFTNRAMAASEVIQLDSESSEDEYEVRPRDKLLLGVCVEAEGCGAPKEQGFTEFF